MAASGGKTLCRVGGCAWCGEPFFISPCLFFIFARTPALKSDLYPAPLFDLVVISRRDEPSTMSGIRKEKITRNGHSLVMSSHDRPKSLRNRETELPTRRHKPNHVAKHGAPTHQFPHTRALSQSGARLGRGRRPIHETRQNFGLPLRSFISDRWKPPFSQSSNLPKYPAMTCPGGSCWR